MAKKKKAATPKREKKAAAPKPPKGQWDAAAGLPDAGDMRLSRGGVTAESEYQIQLAFSNGYSVKVATVEKDSKTRDLVVAWLRKRLGADRS